MKSGILKSQIKNSPLQTQKRIHASGAGSKSKNLLFSMNLTTLIDAFCILVIFLLSNMNGQAQNLALGKGQTLPTASVSEIMSSGIVVKLENNEIFVDEEKVSTDDLVKALVDRKSAEKNALIVQADKNSDYDKISLILRAGGQAGYDKYAFAVLPGTFAAAK